MMMLNNARCLLLAAAVMPTIAVAGSTPECEDTPATFEWVGSNPAVRIWGDGLPYIDGQDRVTAVLMTCTQNGDATLNLLSSSRTLFFDLTAAVPPSNGATPTGTASPGVALRSYINVRRMLSKDHYNDLSSQTQYSFTTALTSSLYYANSRTQYYLRLVGPSNDGATRTLRR